MLYVDMHDVQKKVDKLKKIHKKTTTHQGNLSTRKA